MPVGLPLIFTATASGTAPLAYQWQLNGINLPSRTGNSYTNPAVAAGDVGAYQLVVTNAGGAITSSVAMLTIGPVAAWGNNTYGQALPPPGLTNVIAVGAGNNFSLALISDGTVNAWGGGRCGQQIFTAGLNSVVAISAGSGHALALRTDGTVVAWGANNYGQTNVPPG